MISDLDSERLRMIVALDILLAICTIGMQAEERQQDVSVPEPDLGSIVSQARYMLTQQRRAA